MLSLLNRKKFSHICLIPKTPSLKKDLSIALMQTAGTLLILSPGLYLLHTQNVNISLQSGFAHVTENHQFLQMLCCTENTCSFQLSNR